MQKKLIAVAVAALASTGAMAQVTMYGIADAYVGMFSTKGDATAEVAAKPADLTKTPINTGTAAVPATVASTAKSTRVGGGLLSGPRVGLKAEEDLGDGQKAVALYEAAINLDDGSSALFGRSRQAYVGLETGAGRFSLGQQYAPGYFAPTNHDGFAGAIISPQSILSLNSGSTITPNSGARINNSINWVSKPMGPVSVNALVGFGEDTKDSADARPNEGKVGNFHAVGVNAKIAGLTADAVMQYKRTSDASAQKESFIGANYDLGMAKIGLSTQTNKKEVDGKDAVEDKITQFSVIVKVGGGNIHLASGKMTSDTKADDGQTSTSIAYTHALGKRTTAYVGYNVTKRDTAGTINTVGVQANATEATAFAGGVRLTF